MRVSTLQNLLTKGQRIYQKTIIYAWLFSLTIFLFISFIIFIVTIDKQISYKKSLSCMTEHHENVIDSFEDIKGIEYNGHIWHFSTIDTSHNLNPDRVMNIYLRSEVQ